MNINDYINSGILELYVAGKLSETESIEVYNLMLKHPEVLQEVLEIEASIVKLTASVSPKKSISFNTIKGRLNNTPNNGKVISLNKSNTKWINYSGWAAAIVLAGGLLWTIDQKSTLEDQIQTVNTEKDFIEIQMENSKTDLVETKNLLNIIRDKSIINIPLEGQAAAPGAYATVYWDKKDDTVYLDLQGLPEPPEGKVYQVWSLTLNPLTPTNLGTIDDFIKDDNKIFTLKNTNQSQAFGITLEPAGGSQSPTLEQLYTLGALASL
ncbi:anti-sigma factor domain-containing protein [Psychroserpens sp. NJDZ02]|uniref:anti-sigma factor n=1 Tax=Psychroserpens sp. NJDZ02 TaxID=2570561 RepID=UPI0010A7BE2F|nr:anti-sigma factor [Psychroserpens sp. NJDZ02]QCE42171.1 anti-sigma factor [Psychroserpens sp. NJDZ02]